MGKIIGGIVLVLAVVFLGYVIFAGTQAGNVNTEDSATSVNAEVATYTATMPSEEGDHDVELELHGDGEATLTRENDEGETVEETGTWERRVDGNVAVTLTGSEGEEYDEPVVIVFETNGDALVAVDYDEATYGEAGFTLESEGDVTVGDLEEDMSEEEMINDTETNEETEANTEIDGEVDGNLEIDGEGVLDADAGSELDVEITEEEE